MNDLGTELVRLGSLLRLHGDSAIDARALPLLQAAATFTNHQLPTRCLILNYESKPEHRDATDRNGLVVARVTGPTTHTLTLKTF